MTIASPMQAPPPETVREATVYKGLRIRKTEAGEPILNDPRLALAMEALLVGGTQMIVFDTTENGRFRVRTVDSGAEKIDELVETNASEFGVDPNLVKAFRWAAGYALASEDSFEVGVTTYFWQVGRHGVEPVSRYFGTWEAGEAWAVEQAQVQGTWRSGSGGKVPLLHTACGQWVVQDFDDSLHHWRDEVGCTVPLSLDQVGTTLIMVQS